MTESAPTAARGRERTRQRLLDAAAQVFAEVGLAAASVEAVCERAGFTRGAFYSNFESKDELFLELAGIVAGERVEAVRSRVADLEQDGGFETRPANAFAIIEQVLDVSADDRLGVLLMSEIRIHALRNPELASAYLRQEEEMQRGVAQIVADIGRAKGIEFRVSADEAARIMLLVWDGAAMRAAMADADAEELRRRTSTELALVAQLIIVERESASQR